jgi:hypothetical protein
MVKNIKSSLQAKWLKFKNMEKYILSNECLYYEGKGIDNSKLFKQYFELKQFKLNRWQSVGHSDLAKKHIQNSIKLWFKEVLNVDISEVIQPINGK